MGGGPQIPIQVAKQNIEINAFNLGKNYKYLNFFHTSLILNRPCGKLVQLL